jgi:hypothetical protein
LDLLTQALSFPAIVLPAFVATALLLSVVRFRNTLAAASAALALACCALAMMQLRDPPQSPAPASSASIEADMLVTRGNSVELWVNDWQHPSERVSLVPRERHVYKFNSVPQNITLLRLDPTDVSDAHITLYGLTVKLGNQTVHQFTPAELKTWTLVNLAASGQQDGALSLDGTSDDPILWTSPLAIQLPAAKLVERRPFFARPVVLGAAALLFLLLAVLASRSPLAEWLSRPVPAFNTPVALLILVLLAAGATLYLQRQAVDSDIGLDVDLFASRGNFIEVRLNDFLQPPKRLPLVAGKRQTYHFEKLPNHIDVLRLDPTDQASADVVIYSLTLKSATQTFQQFGPAELRNWTHNNLSDPKDQDGGLAFTDLNDDPILSAPLNVSLPGGNLRSLSTFFELSDGPFLLAIAVFLLVLLASMDSRSGRLQALLVVLASCAAFPTVEWIRRLHLLPPAPVSSTIGFATYNGYAKGNDHLAAFAVLLVSAALGYLFARSTGRPDPVETLEPVAPSRWHYQWMAHVAIFLLVFLNYFPNLLTTIPWAKTVVYPHAGWDESNGLVWAYMVNKGLRPFRDFWYPYSGFYLQFLPFPTGNFTAILEQAIVLWGFYLAVFKAAGRRLGPALVLFGLLFASVLMDMLPGWNRYLLGVDVALFYVAVCQYPRFEWQTHAVFAAFTGYAFFYEPTQVIYASAGIAAHTLLTALEGFPEQIRILRQRLLYAGVPMLAGIACALMVYAAYGMLPGLLDFEASLGDQGNYGALPADVRAWVFPTLHPDSMFLLLFLLASYAVYRWVLMRGQNDPLGAALIVLCGTAYFAMQKQIVRPHAMTQIRIIPYAALLIFGLIVWRERRPAVRSLIALFLGCILGIAVQHQVPSGLFRQDIEAAPGNISATIYALLHNQQDFAQIQATSYSRNRFVANEMENSVVDNLIQAGGLRREDSVYVLGDASIFYILLNQNAPYNSNSYNDSPLSEQQKVLHWFDERHPRYVIWCTDALAYDGVPHAVRLPLIYSRVIEHYAFQRAIGPYHILAERPSNQPVDFAYWRQVLGDQVDLGHLPSLARASEYAPCNGDVAKCDAVLELKYPQSRPARGKATLDIDSSNGTFHLQFDVDPEQREYVINLNRVWFWNPLPKSQPPRISAEDPSAQVVTSYRQERSPVLY